MALPNFTINEQVFEQVKAIYLLMTDLKTKQSELAGVISQLESQDPQMLANLLAKMAEIGMITLES